MVIIQYLIRAYVYLSSWWVAGLILHHQDKDWIVPFLVWLAVVTRLVTWHVSTTPLTDFLARLWRRISASRPTNAVPPRWALVVSWLILVGLIVTVAMTAPEIQDNNATNRGVSLAGLALTIGLLWLTSRDRRAICWYTVLVGLYLQFLVALFVLRTQVGYDVFDWISSRATDLLGFADDGLVFLTDDTVPTLSWFAISVVPPIIFFAALAQLLSYWCVQCPSGSFWPLF